MQNSSQRRELAADEALFHEGDHDQMVYVVESGRIETFQRLPSGELQHVLIAGPGELCGERALLGETRRNTTAVATEPTIVNTLSEAELTERLSAADPLLKHLLLAAIERCETLQRDAADAKAASILSTPTMNTAGASPTAVMTDELHRALVDAMSKQELSLHFQPVVRVNDGSVAGFEVLLRWQRPGVGCLLPHEFLWAAEESGVITQIGEWMSGVACASMNRLDQINSATQNEAAPLFLSINLSPRQCQLRLPQVLERALAAHHLRPQRLRLEIAETTLVERLDELHPFLERCKALGVRLTVDNVGTGPSVLPYLRHLPVDTLTMADALIHDMAQHATSRTVVAAICQLAADLELDTVAKGVETAQQHAAVHAAGFRYAQGFYYGAPMPFDDCVRYLQSRAQATQPLPLSA